MDTPQNYRVKFVADESFAEQVRLFARQQSQNLSIESEGTEEDATQLGFDLAAVSAIVTIVSGTLYVGELAAKILNWMHHSRTNKVVIQTPFQTFELNKAAGLTEEDVSKFLKAA